MTMQTTRHSQYMGATIFRQWGGSALPYTAFIDGHGTKAADSLAGVKSLIRDAMKGAKQ